MVALVALVRLLSTVSEQMSFQISSLIKRFVALSTFVQLLTSVSQKVSPQMISSTE